MRMRVLRGLRPTEMTWSQCGRGLGLAVTVVSDMPKVSRNQAIVQLDLHSAVEICAQVGTISK